MIYMYCRETPTQYPANSTAVSKWSRFVMYIKCYKEDTFSLPEVHLWVAFTVRNNFIFILIRKSRLFFLYIDNIIPSAPIQTTLYWSDEFIYYLFRIAIRTYMFYVCCWCMKMVNSLDTMS